MSQSVMITDEFNKPPYLQNRAGSNFDSAKIRSLAHAFLTGSMTAADIETHNNLPHDQKAALQQMLQSQQM